MKPTNTSNEIHESTYALLMRSENENRSLLEIVAYALVILSAVAAIWQFAHQPISPITNLPRTTSVTQADVANDG
jgi:cytoskeletal protein RodZ